MWTDFSLGLGRAMANYTLYTKNSNCYSHFFRQLLKYLMKYLCLQHMPFRFVFLFVLVLQACLSFSQIEQWQLTPLPKLTHDIVTIDIDSAHHYLRLTSAANQQLEYNGYLFNTLNTDTFPIDINPVDSLTIGPISDKIQHNGQIYFATLNNGIWIREGQRIQQFFIQDQPVPQNILALETFENQLFILTTTNQLFIWKSNTYDLVEYSIPKTEYISDLSIDHWSQLWLLGESNLFYKKYNDNAKAPQVKLIDIQSSFNSIAQPWTHLEFNAEDLILSIKSTLTYLPGHTVDYQYRLKQDQWSPFSNNPEINITNLAPGDYEFQVRAKSATSELGYSQTIPFKVKQSFWGSIWPWLIGGIGSLLLMWAFSFNRQRQSLQSIKNSANKYRLENQLLKSKQETQQLQMNPHFLFNSLNTIQGIIALGDAKKARQLLNHYSQLMRSLLDQSREDAITLEHEVQFLSRYLELEKAARNDKFDFEFHIDPSIDLAATIPPMILQPLIENAIVHGMKGIQHQGIINIIIKESESGILATIDDNGVGRDRSTSNHKSHGVAILTERLQSYASFSRLQDINIIDKMENDESTGTRVIVELPKLS